jgi:hypothetical protein
MKVEDTIETFHFFFNGYWQYENKKLVEVIKLLSMEEREEFDCDCRNMRWDTFIRDYIKGMGIWALGED